MGSFLRPEVWPGETPGGVAGCPVPRSPRPPRPGSDHIVIRSVSDLAGVSAIEDDRFLPEAAANSARLVLGLVHRLQQHDGDLSVGT